ncbi:hypothetical protein DHW03_15520 [Pedobacter yonginense]|uniref:Uncharacterized protein n=1 Tax=Pedobacter yonginense TaxID=651869 RepID=A0A317EHA5_9SPHI|nr:hypothetical protein [Pedobacter yonginense]PWS26201.1 hypothetical protein DHW03_15520 [Pedobacter yonginense]
MNPKKGRSPPTVPNRNQSVRTNNIAPIGEIINQFFYKHSKFSIMKNQSINSANSKADFIDLNAKNPIYQPLAGKVPNVESKAEVTNQAKKEDVAPASKAEENEPSVEAPKSLGAVVLTEQKAEEKKAEKVETKIEKPSLNLEGTLKLVEELHRRMVQRGRLVHTIDNLDKFELEQKEEAEDTTSNYYQGCELEITDDKRNKFSTKNPVIIKAVATFVRDLCTNRLGEIEAEITIPA